MDVFLDNLPIILSLVFGMGLLVAEIFLPGFGVAGISGIVLEVVAVTLTFMWHGPLAALGVLLISLAMVALAVSASLRSVAKGKLSRSKMVLQDTESGYQSADDLQVFLGREGETVTPLRPTGMAEFEGVKLNVISDGAFVPEKARVRIVSVEGSRILVKPC